MDAFPGLPFWFGTRAHCCRNTFLLCAMVWCPVLQCTHTLLKEHSRDIGRIGAPQRVPSQWYLRSRGTMAVYGAAFYWPCRRAMPGPERSGAREDAPTGRPAAIQKESPHSAPRSIFEAVETARSLPFGARPPGRREGVARAGRLGPCVVRVSVWARGRLHTPFSHGNVAGAKLRVCVCVRACVCVCGCVGV